MGRSKEMKMAVLMRSAMTTEQFRKEVEGSFEPPIRDQREVDAESILLKYGIDPDKRVSDDMITFTSNPIKDPVMERRGNVKVLPPDRLQDRIIIEEFTQLDHPVQPQIDFNNYHLFTSTYMSDPIKESVLDINNLCEHRKDCAHPHCDCGLAPGCNNIRVPAELSKCADLKGIDGANVFDNSLIRGPIAQYNKLVAIRNRKVEQGIPLSYGK